MSRGFGKVQRELEKILERMGGRAYSIVELCTEVYHEPSPEKRHRVAVLRAVDSVRKHYPWIGRFYGSKTYFLCDCRDLHAYALTQMRCRYDEGQERAEERLRYELAHPSDIRNFNDDLKPETGLWWLYCEATRAEYEGEKTHAETLWTKYQEADKKARAKLETLWKGYITLARES